MNTTKILGEAVGIQRQDIIDRTEEQTAEGLTGAVILGRFKRGRVDVPMAIHQGNIRGQLGHDPKNPDYIAVQDCLDAGVPSVQVLRLGQNEEDGGSETDPPDGGDRFVISCTPPEVQQRIVLNKIRDTLPFLTFNNVVFDIYINGLPAASSVVLLDAAAMDLVGLKVEDLAGNGRKISITPKSDRHRAFELRPTFMPSFTDDTDIEEGHAVVENSSFHFCLASKPSPAENWDIKYLVNGSWIYESTGPIVEQDANRNILYRNTATALVIADTVTELGAGAFGNWSNLTSVELGQSLKSIANSVFVNCSNLTEFICPNSLESLGYSALSNCNKIKLIEFGTSFISIGSSALVKCTSVETAVFRARVMPTIGNYAFGNGGTGSGPEPTAVYVPDDLFAEYENAIWHLARITTFLPLSTYESQNPD